MSMTMTSGMVLGVGAGEQEEGAVGAAVGARVHAHPSEAYLRGAVWLGRNLSMVAEDLTDSVEEMRKR